MQSGLCLDKAIASTEGIYTINLQDYKGTDTVYTGAIYFDEQGDPDGKFIFDSGSDWIVTHNYYDHTLSESLSSLEVYPMHIDYESLKLKGNLVEDLVCLERGAACVRMEFIEVMKVTPSNFEYDGVIGMGPINHGQGDRLIEQLYRHNIINELKATFWLNKSGT